LYQEKFGNPASVAFLKGPGHEYPFQACNGPKLTFVDGDRISVDDAASFYEVGSLLVKAGTRARFLK
jgi:hypothetical protein